jgi:hypothetical protein
VPGTAVDLAALVIGSLFVAIGAVASATALRARPRAILTDLITRQPFAAVRINIPLVIPTIPVWFAAPGRSGQTGPLVG